MLFEIDLVHKNSNLSEFKEERGAIIPEMNGKS